MVQPNYQYRGTSSNAAEVQDVNDAFARSVLWAFQIAAASDGRVLVDFTEFLVRDANDIAGGCSPGPTGSRRAQHRLHADDQRLSRRTPRWRQS